MKLVIKSKLGTYASDNSATETDMDLMTNLLVSNEPTSTFRLTMESGSIVIFPV